MDIDQGSCSKRSELRKDLEYSSSNPIPATFCELCEAWSPVEDNELPFAMRFFLRFIVGSLKVKHDIIKNLSIKNFIGAIIAYIGRQKLL